MSAEKHTLPTGGTGAPQHLQNDSHRSKCPIWKKIAGFVLAFLVVNQTLFYLHRLAESHQHHLHEMDLETGFAPDQHRRHHPHAKPSTSVWQDLQDAVKESAVEAAQLPHIPHLHMTLKGSAQGPDGSFTYRQYVSIIRRVARLDVSKDGQAQSGYSWFQNKDHATVIYNRTNGDGLNGLVCYHFPCKHTFFRNAHLIPTNVSFETLEYKNTYLANRYRATVPTPHQHLVQHLLATSASTTATNGTKVQDFHFWLEAGTLRPVAGRVDATNGDGEDLQVDYEVDVFLPTVPEFIFNVPKTIQPYCQAINKTEAVTKLNEAYSLMKQ